MSRCESVHNQLRTANDEIGRMQVEGKALENNLNSLEFDHKNLQTKHDTMKEIVDDMAVKLRSAADKYKQVKDERNKYKKLFDAKEKKKKNTFCILM